MGLDWCGAAERPLSPLEVEYERAVQEEGSRLGASAAPSASARSVAGADSVGAAEMIALWNQGLRHRRLGRICCAVAVVSWMAVTASRIGAVGVAAALDRLANSLAEQFLAAPPSPHLFQMVAGMTYHERMRRLRQILGTRA